MAKRVHLAFGFILLFCLLRKTRTFSEHVEVPWYIGCYNDSEVSEDALFEPAYEEDRMTPVYCVSFCTFNESFRYAAVRDGSICICLTQIQQENSTSHTLCNVSCHGDQNIICGGRNTSSVYSTAVPLLVSLNITLPNHVKTNTSVTAVSKLSIKRQRGEVSNLDRIKQGNQTADDILINWYSGVKFWNKTWHTLHGNQTRTSTTLSFATPGNHRICVEASNLFSHRKMCTTIDVVAPVQGLQLVTVFQGGKKLNLFSPLVVTSHQTVLLKYLTASGSRPRFQFDFGKGSSPFIVMDNFEDRYSSVCSCVAVSHVFKSCGNFTVNVTASNAVSLQSVTQPGQVMVVMPIGAVKIHKNGSECMYVEGNVSSTLTAKVKHSQGCTVFFQWNFNDSSPNVTTTAPSVSHNFSSSRSFYYVTVVAFNEYSRKEATQKICPQERLQGVILESESSHMIVSTEYTIPFTAQLTPRQGQGTVIYKLYRSDQEDPVTGGPEFPSNFKRAGRYVVFVVAINKVSRVVSNETVVTVFERVLGLSIHHKTTLLLGEPVHLSADLQKGTNVTFYWNFGEGLPNSTFNTSSPNATYNYTKEGRYKINVIAKNDIGSEEKESITVYITKVPQCYPPKIDLLGLSGIEVNRSKEIRLEADTTVTCIEDRELSYLWTIIHDASGTKVRPEGVSLTEQVLIIPPCMLDYGKHYFQLKVEVKGTFLIAEKEIILRVVKSPLVAVIDGGTTKVVGRKNKEITMDASSSHDPDFPDQGHQIRFQWTCHPIGHKNMSCFNESKASGIRQNQSVLTFQMDWLLSHDTFEFAVTVSKDSRNFTALQILYVDFKKSHLLSANCPQCDKGLINPSVPLVITGLCLTCPLDNTKITYTWEIFHVVVGDSKLVAKEGCKPAPEDSDILNSDVSSTSYPSPTTPPLQQLIVGTTLVRPTNRSVTTRTVKAINPQNVWIKFASGSICRDSNQILGPTSGPSSNYSTKKRHPAESGSGGDDSGSGGGGGHGTGSGSGCGGVWGTGSGTGTGSGNGTGCGNGTGSGSKTDPVFRDEAKNRSMVSTNTSQQNFTTRAPGSDDPVIDGSDMEYNEPKDIYTPQYTPLSAKHSGSIITLKRRRLNLPETYTGTGLKSQNFVLLDKYKYFIGGLTYMVAFKVSDGRTGWEGKATVYFNTSDIPECGVCRVTPSAGVAMETTFQLTCSKWRAESLGLLSYHVSYSTDGDNGNEKILIYSGYRSVVPFVLPPGLASVNHAVQIYVTVSNGEGTKQRLQIPLRVKVIPQFAREGVSMEEVLLNQTFGKYLSVLQEVGDEQGVRNFITALANSLNRLGSVQNVSSKFYLRIQIRESLLLLIKDLAVNEKNSVFQTCLALQALTVRPNELTERSVETASRILQHLGEVMQTTRRRMRSNKKEDRFLLSQEFIEAMTRVTSNLIEASSMLIDSNARMFGRQDTEENVLLRATEAAERLIKAKLSVQVLGEAPLILTTPNIWVNATQLTSISNSLFSLGDVEFHMPANLEKQLNTVTGEKEGKCYGTMMTVYKENPFFSDMHHTKVGSLSISNCHGEEIEVRNLSSSITISIPHLKHKVQQFTEEYLLHWNHENNHIINHTEKMINQVLHIHFKPLSTLAPGFVVKLILTSSTRTDSSSEKRIEYSDASSGKVIDLYLSHEQLTNASGSVNLKVVLEDTAFFRIKSINKGPSLRYSLIVHWKGCFYWNTEIRDWSTDGCEVMDQRTDDAIFCRCNHLTAFSGGFVYPPNSLTIQDLTDANKVKDSPVTLALVISIVTLYLVLLGFCVRADKHDRKKLGAVYLGENVASGVCHRFQITVQTGHWFGSGTSANVYLTLHGDDWVSDPIELKSPTGKALFERSSCDVFVHRAEWKYPCRGIGGQTDLERLPGKGFSDVSKIHVWHDNSGDYPGWFLEHVIVKNVNSGSKWFFNCNRWLAVEEEDGKVECEFKETSKHSSSLKKSFSEHFSKSILDYHLWFSLFGRPSYSRFSRAQRLTCCVSLLLSFLCVNIAWYRPKTEVPEVLGFIDFTAEGIWIGVLCSIVALPVNLLWVLLFRYSRRSFRHHVKVYPMISEPQTDTTELASSSVLDQSLETVLILKNIGERKRWFETVWELDDMRSDTCSCLSVESLESESDTTSLGYNSGQGALGFADRPMAKGHAALVDTCEFLADVSPGKKNKSLEFEKRSTYSVSLSSTASEGSGGYRSRFSLPHVCVYVAWVGCLLTAATAGLFTVWYGVSFGWDLSIRWLQSLLFSFLESFLVSQPIMVVAFILYMAYKSKRRMEDDDVDEGFEDLSSSALHDIHYGHLNQGFEEETHREDDYFNPALALRRRLRYLKFLKPPSKSKLSEARNKRVQSRALWNYTIELMIFILFLLVTCLLAASVMSPDVYRLNQSIKRAFIRSEDVSLTAPRSIKDAWKEISAALHENSASSSYTPFTILLRDSQSLLFGRTTITQYKTDVLRACDQHSGSGNQTTCHAQCHSSDGAWMSLKLNQTSEESAKQLKEVTDSQWINECTREMTVEFAVYTPFLRAISAATLSAKASFTGNSQCNLELNSFPAFYASTEQGYFLRICKLMFGVLLLYLLQHEFFLAWKMSKKYFTDFWRLTQLLTIAISSLCVVVYIRWSVCLYALLREVETTSQSQVFYYAQLVSMSQDTLQASYSLLLFFLIIRCVYLLRSFRSVARLGEYLASVSCRLLACTVLIVTFMMAFVHTGHLLFGRLHSAFKSFGETFLLVSSFFRMEGVNHYQGPMVEQYPMLVLFYFGLFLVGFYVFMRGTTAAVFLCGIPHSKKRRSKVLADFAEDFVRRKLQSLREKTQRRERRDSTSDEDEDEESEDEELEAYENDAPFPMEHVLDEVQAQLDELSLRMDNLMGSELFNDRSSLDDLVSCSEREEDVEYLYQREPTSPVSSTGYDSDHSNTSAAKWQLSSSSSQDLSDYYSKYQTYPGFYDSSEWSPGPGRHASSRPVRFTLGSCSSLDMAVYHGEKPWKLEDPSCSSCYEMDRNNSLFTDYGEKGLTSNVGNRRSFGLGDDDLRSGVLRDGELRGGVLRDGVWHVGDMRNGAAHTSIERDGILRDVFLPDETRASLVGSFCSDGVCSQDLSSCSSHSLLKRPDPDKEPIRPKTIYGAARTHPRRGHETSALRPSTTTGGSSTETATGGTPDLELRRKTKKSHLRRTKGFFRSSVVHPGNESFALAPSPPLSHQMAHGKESGLKAAGGSQAQPAWVLAPSPSNRGSIRNLGPHAKPATSEKSLLRSTDPFVLEDSRPNSPNYGLAEGGILTCPDPHVPDAHVKGLLGDIIMNRRLGTEIINDDSPECFSPGDKYRLA